MNIVNPSFNPYLRQADAAWGSRLTDRWTLGLGQDGQAHAGGQVDTYAPSFQANEAGIYSPDKLGFRTLKPTVAADGDVRKATDTKSADASFNELEPNAQRAAFVKRMETKLKGKVGNPPTQTQLTAYFKTFNTAEKRSEARGELEKYFRAFYIHVGNSEGGDKTSDVKYSKETTYLVGGKVFSEKAKAESEVRKTGAKGIEVQTADPSSWNDITRQPQNASDGRTVIDCEGYAYMAGVLLGAAGYKPTMISTGTGREQHAMALFREPNGGDSVVVSNSRTFSGPAGTEQELMQQGWTSTAAEGPSGGFHEGKTPSKAQVEQVAAEERQARAQAEAFERRLRETLDRQLNEGAP